MSAQPITTPVTTEVRPGTGARSGSHPLRLLPSARPILSPLGFGILIAILVAFGLAVVMVVSTSVAAQSRELTGLRREALELSYTAAGLTTQLQSNASTASLALRASELGMVPNPYPAFIRLSDGAILGEPRAVTGEEVSYLGRLTTAETTAPGLPVLPLSDPAADLQAPGEQPEGAQR